MRKNTSTLFPFFPSFIDPEQKKNRILQYSFTSTRNTCLEQVKEARTDFTL